MKASDVHYMYSTCGCTVVVGLLSAVEEEGKENWEQRGFPLLQFVFSLYSPPSPVQESKPTRKLVSFLLLLPPPLPLLLHFPEKLEPHPSSLYFSLESAFIPPLPLSISPPPPPPPRPTPPFSSSVFSIRSSSAHCAFLPQAKAGGFAQPTHPPHFLQLLPGCFKWEGWLCRAMNKHLRTAHVP